MANKRFKLYLFQVAQSPIVRFGVSLLQLVYEYTLRARLSKDCRRTARINN